jgi:peptidoglycan/xylan/chitin deacetylase (PgdA/CDA1 family)
MIFCLTVDDVCLDGYSTEEHMRALLRFFESEGIRSTFFVVPRAEGIPLKERSEYVELLKQAVAEGHALGQHGLEHDRFETGIPPSMILDLPHEGPAREHLAKERAKIEKNLEIHTLRERLAQGRWILRDALGFEIFGFRAPCLSVCDNLFTALDAEGFHYDSSRYLQEGGWDLLQDKPLAPRPIAREDFDQAQYLGRMRSLPLTTEYTWYLRPQKFEETMSLARYDFTSCLRVGIPFVTLAHVSPLNQCENGCGFELYRRLIDYAQKQASAAGEQLRLLNLDETCESFFATT